MSLTQWDDLPDEVRWLKIADHDLRQAESRRRR